MFVDFVMEEYNIITYFFGLYWLHIMFKSKRIFLCVAVGTAPPTDHNQYKFSGLNV